MIKKANIFTLTDWAPVIHHSKGLIKAHDKGFYEYEKEAILPSFEWETLNTSSHLKKFDVNSHNLGENILLGKLPNETIELIDFFETQTCKAREEIFDRFQNRADVFNKLTKQLEQFINSKIFQNSQNVKYHRLSVQPPGFKSITYNILNHDQRILIGLHIDRSEYFPIGECYKSKQRLCINLGETRYLYIFDISIDQLKLIYKEKCNKELTFETLIETYYDLFKDYPVKIVEMPHGGFYIVPTDNLIHDTGVMNHKSYDVSLHYIGNFNLNTENVYEQY